MNRTFWISVIVYLLATFVIAAGWHLFLFRDLYIQLAIFSRQEPLIPLGLISMSIQAVLVAYLYPKIRGEGHPALEGLRFGIIIGALMASIGVFAEAGKQNVTSLSTWLVLENIYYLLQFSVVGVLIGLVHGQTRFSNSLPR
ncbi:hypothetical protein CH373_06110 [Leptospira perolatii]|uniref:DUF1761 domain-containing protein n=1 Tax=Leptospira perolatii TaxID=2023191 RepID=A0A2M9ZNU4_9LEPT|nr:hypothetical protein [Leptospira perolatii]PJZ70841.1 hypothetical protein CH360_04840 [Leptospira perolatii]PJZ73737.1 hypothetical protein CH373_06110 [Leptospira perolatii]